MALPTVSEQRLPVPPFWAPLVALLLSALCLPPFLHAQTDAAPAAQPGYRLSTGTRLVLTDVTVTDANGNPVPGLPATAFQVFDDNHPQGLSSFEEHTAQPAAPVLSTPAVAPATYSNDILLHPPPVLNVLLIDIKNIDIEDQLFLNYRLTRLLTSLPAGEPLAIYWCRGPNAILLQQFTADHSLLLAALGKALPRFPPPGREFFDDFNTLQQLANSLAQLPGRKNILWYSGGSALLPPSTPGIASLATRDEAQARAVYDQLELSRIAVYPIDARGLSTSLDSGMTAQHQLMDQTAQATGGHAFYNNNGLDLIAERLLGSDGNYYTLSYAPRDFHADGKWHHVRVELNLPHSGYGLSYRRGYYADNPSQQPQPARTPSSPGAFHRASTGTTSASAFDWQSPPILFQVRPTPIDTASPAQPSASLPPAKVILPLSAAKQKRGTVLYSLRYRLPLDAFTTQTSGKGVATNIGVAVVAFNEYGSIATHRAEQLTLSLDPRRLPLQAGDSVIVEQQVALPKGNTTLFCAVWDVATERLGTLQIPLVVKPAPKE